jgi:hypothetical protein
MPRAQDFSQSVIYHIRNKETKEVIYVGSTTNFQQRKTKHKYRCNYPNDTKHHFKCYVCIRENGGWDCFEVIPVEFLKLENKTQLVIAEQAEIDKQDTLKNQIRAHIPEEDHKDKIKEYQKKYYEIHKEQISAHKKEYYETRKEQSKEYNKEYREIHKDKISARKKEPIECPICKSKTRRGNMPRHQRSEKCKSHIKLI